MARRRSEEDLDEEIRTHLAMARQDRVDRGESAVVAERRAREEFGNVALIQEVTREMWGWGALDRLGQDLKYGLRQIRRSPGFSVVVTVTLALGIGVNTTVFSIVDAILFQPMHARNPQEMVAIFASVNRGAPYGSSSYLDYTDIRERSRDVFQDLAAFTLTPVNLNLGSRTQHLTAGIVSGNYFQLLGSDAVLGRTFLAEEDQALDPRSVAILTARTWRERFSADPGIVGKTVRVNQQSFTVIGVIDDRYSRLRHFFEADLFVPAAARGVLSGNWRQVTDVRQARQFFLLGRRAAGVSIKQAQARLRVVAAELHAIHPKTWSDDRGQEGTITVVSEPDSRVPPQARAGVIAFSVFLVAIVGTVLMIACTNLASLALARA